MGEGVDFVDDEDFLRSASDFGLTIDDGVKELVDNSLDANSSEIRIELHNDDSGNITLIVSDNGDGIPTSFDGVEGIPHVMAFGNNEVRISSTNKSSKIGRFGFGLSQTITCLAKEKGNAYVWSKNKENASWRMCHYSFSDLIENQCKLPMEYSGTPPRLTFTETGTMVMIEIRTGVKMRVGSIQNRLLKYMGRTYRKFLEKGLTIKICTSTPSSKPNWKSVHLKDPLALNPESEEALAIGLAEEYLVEDFIFDGTNEDLGEIIDPVTGSYARIEFRISRMSRAKVRRNLKLNSSVLLKDDNEDKTLRKYGIGSLGQGFSLLREGREIAESGTFGIYKKHPGYDYIHGEINFPLILDQFFSIQTNKSRYNVRKDLQDALKIHLKEIHQAAYNDHQKDGFISDLVKDIEPRIPTAEVIGKKVAPLLPKPQISEKEQEKALELRKEISAKELKKFSEKMKPKISEVENRLESAINEGNEGLIEQLKYDLDVLSETQKEWLARIDSRWETSSPNRIFVDDLFNKEVYQVIDGGDEAHLTVNSETEFYKRIYSTIKQNAHLHTLIDLMLSSLGYAEFIDMKTNPERGMYWQIAREEVSLHIDQFVRIMPVKAEEVSEDES